SVGAITLPYWDHMATAKQIIQYFDGTLTFESMVEPQNQARPLFPRLIFVANAALTRWDIRSEYVYIYLTIYGSFAALLFAWWQLFKKVRGVITVSGALLLSIISFSPVAAMNQYWSLMLLATLSYFCAVLAFLVTSMRPFSWGANVLAAALAWISAYSISQGLFVFPAILILHLLIGQRAFRPTRWSIFWLANLLVCYAVYLPGVALGGVTQPLPTVFDFVAFVAVYIGNPLGSLLWFPEMGVVWLRETIVINFAVGLLLLLLAAFTAWKARRRLRLAEPEVLIFYSFGMYAIACAVVTGWGRASGEFAVASANSSRYSTFAAALLFGLIFYYGSEFRRGSLVFAMATKAILAVFVAASTVSYVRAIPVYKAAHNDNEWLADVYGPNAEVTNLDRKAYPDPEYFDPKRRDLLRLGIGPYRLLPLRNRAIYSGAFVGAVPLKSGTTVSQKFRVAFPIIRSISFPVVTWGKWPSSYTVLWKATDVQN
ncbi:hypothetical protein, partial [Rhodopseudomonas sp. B29]|uniref:hypothetical protein n=1 Tax=Rhodopseudomonas sp. B29 TaxID=95607 RepID=UPI0003B4BF99